MSLSRPLRALAAALCAVSLAAPPGLAAEAPPPRNGAGPLDVRVGQAKDFSRVEFRWAGGARVTSRREGDKLTLRFSRDAKPNLTLLHVSPPPWLKGAEARHSGGVLEVVLTLAPGAETKVGQADGAIFVNAFQKPAPPAAPAETAKAEAPPPSAEPTRANPMPKGGVVRMAARTSGNQLLLEFPWAAPAGAAVFRRAGSLWVVFDAPATLDVSKAPKDAPLLIAIQASKGPDYSAVRIAAPAGAPVAAYSEGSVWTVAIGPGPAARPSIIKAARDGEATPPTLTAQVAGVTRIVSLPDPGVGDVVTVVTALGPAKALPTRREFVEMALLPSAQGLAVEPYASDLQVTHEGDLVRIGRPQGLSLSSSRAGVARQASADGAPQAAALPAGIDPNWGKLGSGGYLARYDALMAAAAAETAKGSGASTNARMGLARFMVGSELSFEAIGVLNAIAAADPKMLEDAEFRGLRGVARVMARRYKEAEADFSAPVLTDDPSSALWRAYIYAQEAHWTEARGQFAKGADAFAQFSPLWKSRFARSEALAAFQLGDLDGAMSAIRLALSDKPNPFEQLSVRLLQARIIEAQGHKDRALAVYRAVARAPVDYISAPALLRATQIEYEMGKLTPLQAANVFDGLRYRWRGDATELETIRLLGNLYLGQGRYREALEALRSAGVRLPDQPEAIQLQADLGQAFRALFLDGQADGLEPIQALALFYDFKELTPIGADGDQMVRKLVRRLVDVDLLDQAAELLSYQANNRLEGVPRAQVATDLAVIYLMDRKPEQALQAIASSRTTILPNALNAERRLVEARALIALGRLDHAAEVLDRDTGKDAQDLRAEIAWRGKSWKEAGGLFEKSLGDRFKKPEPLTPDDEGRLLRAGVAYSLAEDDAALTRLQTRYGGFYEKARNPDALRVALAGSQSGTLAIGDFNRVTADNEVFAGWVSKMKQRFRQKADAAPAAPAAAAPAKTAEAAAPAPQKG